jgi:hypothetical protein
MKYFLIFITSDSDQLEIEKYDTHEQASIAQEHLNEIENIIDSRIIYGIMYS